MKPLRIAMLAHSTLPRGGVVHAMALAEALHDRGHSVSLHAPDASGRGFFRPMRCHSVTVAAAPIDGVVATSHTNGGVAVAMTNGGVAAMARQRIEDYLAHFDRHGTEGFDLWHAQDSISANALATLVTQGRIAGYVRTVHHLDEFDDPALMALQTRGVVAASQLLCVSQTWQRVLADGLGLAADCVGNGVDAQRYTAAPQPGDDEVAARWGLRVGRGRVLLAVGGVEARKNTLATLQAYLQLRATQPTAQLVVAGGASLLDHSAYRARFEAALQASGLCVMRGEARGAAQGAGTSAAPADVILTGPLPDADLPALYRAADALLFPSLKEGFGLVVLEALASGTPVVVSRIAPFTEHLDDRCVNWCDPLDAASIAQATARALRAETARAQIAASAPLLDRYTWAASAAQHEAVYARVLGRRLSSTAPVEAPTPC